MQTNESMAKKNETICPKRIAEQIDKGQLRLCDNYKKTRCWEVYAEIEDLNGEKFLGFVQCRMCKKIFHYNNFSCSNLVKHKCYLEKFGKKKESAVSIVEVGTPKVEVQEVKDIGSDSNNYLLNLITKWLINDCKSYAAIQDTGLMSVFQEFLSLGAKFGTNIDIGKFLPNSATIARNVNEIYEQCFKRVKTDVAAIKGKGFGLTADILTDSYTNQSRIALTMHYLKNATLKFSFLGLKSIEKCTVQNINETIKNILADFNCELSTNTILVTNGDGDIMKALQNIQKLPCISLLLNSVLQKTLEEVPELAELVSAGVELLNYLKESGLDVNFRNPLPDYCPCRWNTISRLLRFIENNWTEICQTLQNQNKCQRIEAVSLYHLTAVVKTLQPFEEAIETLEEENDATLHLVLIYLHQLKKSCDTNDSGFKDIDFVERLKKNLQFHLERILTEDITILHKIAVFLYPPTNKLLVFSDQEKKCIEKHCRRLCIENESIIINPVLEPTIPSTLNKLFADFVEPEENLGPDELIIQELQCYKNFRVQNSDDFDCFSWWESHKDAFPLLYKLSCTVLATPASTASTHQIFSYVEKSLTKLLDVAANEIDLEKSIFINFNGEQDELDSEQ